ncbi:hypothetical protein QR98_0028720 [Sarcoptes scabiei]|uniref:Uncharacterized protein n=1 Tax=Sarcoptes scabiei TaxID=52283 RepID=A0A132A044_SARSC|nr:hypothetical protein QR98_0028720 [Sarcoptes scabiei]
MSSYRMRRLGKNESISILLQGYLKIFVQMIDRATQLAIGIGQIYNRRNEFETSNEVRKGGNVSV